MGSDFEVGLRTVSSIPLSTTQARRAKYPRRPRRVASTTDPIREGRAPARPNTPYPLPTPRPGARSTRAVLGAWRPNNPTPEGSRSRATAPPISVPTATARRAKYPRRLGAWRPQPTPPGRVALLRDRTKRPPAGSHGARGDTKARRCRKKKGWDRSRGSATLPNQDGVENEPTRRPPHRPHPKALSVSSCLYVLRVNRPEAENTSQDEGFHHGKPQTPFGRHKRRPGK